MREYNYSEKVMGTSLEVSLISDNEASAESAFFHIFEMLKSYEKTFSRFIEVSELSRLNHNKHMKVSGSFIEATSIAKKLHADTCGVFNPLLQVSNLGYDKSFENLTSKTAPLTCDPYDINMTRVSIDTSNSMISIGNDQKLDYGGFLKGFLAEKIAISLSHFKGIIINIGGDIFTTGLDENREKFLFNVYNPVTDTYSESFPLENEAMATSGTYKRVWDVNGKKYSHILDNTMNNPKEDIVSATIIAAHGDVAEAYATTAICLGSEKAEKFLNNKDVKYMLIKKDGSIINTIII